MKVDISTPAAMNKEVVFAQGKEIEAYRYAGCVLLVRARVTDQEIISDDKHRRYKRKLSESPNSLFWEYWRI